MELALRALAEPRRREILRLVSGQEMTSGGIATHFDVTGPAISQHLKVLVDSGLVTVRRNGTRRLYKARPEALEELQQYLASFWLTGLETLARQAEAEEKTRRGS